MSSGAEVAGWRVQRLPSSPTTNGELAARAAAGAEPGLVVVTDHQTAGRGRLDRSWETPAGVALTFSALVEPGVPDSRWPLLPLLAGLAVAEGVRRTAGVMATLKWPNDVLVANRKLAGILVERVSGSRPMAVVGIGINVHQGPEQLPVPGATSLAIEGADVGRELLLESVLGDLSGLLEAWRGARGSAVIVLAPYRERCVTIGRQVEVHLPGDEHLVGLATGIDDQGRLVVRTAEGERPVGAGDVVHVRTGSS
ncbi:MAG: biotin--[acetyl-CoA-carboxylase] ligase [Actinomycetota bacterium]|nr:biotin--[acetyl-CoA-carboxylase] ligase [Actinomycetota bacterium]